MTLKENSSLQVYNTCQYVATCIENFSLLQFVAKEGDTVEPGFKIAVISQSSGAATQVEESEKKPEETKPEKKEEKPKPVAEAPPSPKVETSPPKEKPRAPPPPTSSGQSPREPQLPPKDRERRVHT